MISEVSLTSLIGLRRDRNDPSMLAIDFNHLLTAGYHSTFFLDHAGNIFPHLARSAGWVPKVIYQSLDYRGVVVASAEQTAQ